MEYWTRLRFALDVIVEASAEAVAVFSAVDPDRGRLEWSGSELSDKELLLLRLPLGLDGSGGICEG